MKRSLLDHFSLPNWAYLFLLLCFITIGQGIQAQNCDPDTLPPIAICSELLVVNLGPDNPSDCYGPAGPNNQPPAFGPTQGSSVAVVSAMSFDNGSYDACGSNIKFTVQRVAPYSNVIQLLNQVNGQAPCDDSSPDFPSEFERAISEQEDIKFYAGEVNTTQTIAFRVYQLNSNGTIAYHNGQPLVNTCLVQVTVEDKIPPVCTPPAHVTVACENFDPSLVAYGDPVITDNACVDTFTVQTNNSNFNELCQQGFIIRTFRAFDCSGNSSQCTQRIDVTYNQHYFIRFPNDLIVNEPSPTGEYGQPSFFGEDCELIGISYSDEIFTNDPNATIRIERTWTLINWCTYDPLGGQIQVPNPNPNVFPSHPANLPGPIVSAAGTQAPWASTIVKIHPTDPDPTDYSTFWAQDANRYNYTQYIWVVDTFFIGVEGTVFSDTSQFCSYQSGEPLLEGWTVKVTGLTTGTEKIFQTDAQGYYSAIMNGIDSVVTVTLVNAGNFGQGCATVYTVNGILGQIVTQDIPVHLEERCELMSVGIATPLMRRCFNNRYHLQACNLSSALVNNAYVELDLDNYLEYVGGSITGVSQGNNRYRFDLGDLQAGDCASFWVDFYVSCEAPLGATHCTEARIYPYDDCRDNTNWSGADVDVTVRCDGDSVRLKISNIGDGAMAQVLDFVVVEDIIMRQGGNFQLGIDQDFEISFPANGSTWRLEAEEEPFHPFGGIQAAALEGCGGLNQPGLINLFPLSENSPFVALDCRENIGAFDPNDKQAFPVGLGDEHQILPNTDIEYLIRFQNTGTDTAFNVVILDTLSALLDASSVRIGAASHPMEFGMLDGGILRFAFPNIMLPDSNINEPASHGFVKFRISQKADLPDGSLLENKAAIYFDFNEPVITNIAWHTVREYLMLVSTQQPDENPLLQVFPNPAGSVAEFRFEQLLEGARFELQTQLGELMRVESFTGTHYRFERGLLTPGIYFYKINSRNGYQYSGKIVLK